MSPTGRILASVGVFLLAVGSLVWIASVPRDRGDLRKPSGYKALSGTIAEDFSYHVSKDRFPRAICKACRVGKKKLGPISLGALNTLELDEVVLNVPSKPKAEPLQTTVPKAETLQGVSPKADAAATTLVETLGLEPLAGLSEKLKGRKFVAVTIRGLAVNRVVGDRAMPVFRARLVRTEGRTVRVYGLSLAERNAEIPEATLEREPVLRLVWPQGSLVLDLE